MVETLNDIFTKSGSVVVARYKGLTVAQMTELRRRMGGAGAQFKVIKNRLAKIALANTADGAGADLFLEPTGIAFAKDPATAAKVAADFAKTNDKFVIVGGFSASRRWMRTVSRLWRPSHRWRASFQAAERVPCARLQFCAAA